MQLEMRVSEVQDYINIAFFSSSDNKKILEC